MAQKALLSPGVHVAILYKEVSFVKIQVSNTWKVLDGC